MSRTFRRQWVSYKDAPAKKMGRSKTIQGQDIPMRTLVSRYMSGQIFGISSHQTFTDYDEDVTIDEAENTFIPDPCDPLAYQRAELESRTLSRKIESARELARLAKEAEAISAEFGENAPLKET